MITAICPFSNVKKYGAGVAAALNQIEGVSLVIYSAAARSADFEQALQKPVRFIESAVETDDANVTTHVANLYSLMFNLVDTHFTMTFEQDILPAYGAIKDLLESIDNPTLDAVSAVYDDGNGRGFSNVFPTLSMENVAMSALPVKRPLPVAYALVGLTLFKTESLKKCLPISVGKVSPYVCWEASLGARFFDNELNWAAIGLARCLHKGV